MKKAVLMQGVSGSGKSTFVKGLLDNYRQGNHQASYAVCSADDYFGKDYEFSPAALPLAHADCLRKFVMAVQGDVDLVVVDNTNCGAVELAPYVALSQAYGYELRIIRINYLLDVAIERAANGPHKTPARAVLGQHKQLQCYDPPPWWPKVEVIEQGCAYCGSLAPLEGANWECPDCGGV